MPTSAVKTSKSLSAHQGFSLIEILVALLLVALVFLAIPSSEDSRRHRDIQSALDDVDRAARFAANESVLRNSIVRLRFDLDKDPVEYVVEYGPKGDLVIPLPEDESKIQSVKEIEESKKKRATLDGQFTKVEEFSDMSRSFSPEVTMLGMAVSWQKSIIKSGQAAAYFYPTGERDGALFFFSTQDEFAALELRPFMEKTYASFIPYPKVPEGQDEVAKIRQFQDTKMEEFQHKWPDK